MRHLLRSLKAYRLPSFLAPLFKMLEAIFDLLVPVVVAKIINEGIGTPEAPGDAAKIWQYGLILAGMAVVGLAFAVTAQYFSAKAAIGCAADLRSRLFRHIQTLGWGEADALGTSTLITRMTSDINQVQSGVNMFLRLFLRSPFVVAGAFVCALLISPPISLIFLGAIAAMAVIVVAIMRVTSPRYRANQQRLDLVTRATRENLTGVRVIRAFGMEERETEHFRGLNALLTRHQLAVGRISALMNPLTLVAVNAGVILVLKAGGDAVGGGSLLRGEIVALINYMNQILVELVKLANLVVTLSRGAASANRVAQVLDTAPAMAFPEEGAEPAADAPAVVFDHVSLRYGGAGAESLTDISFSCAPDETVGVIGSTGSGKSSLVHLIPRFYDATSGEVRLFGHPVSAYARGTLRGLCGIVPQRAQLFTGTVRSNLLWGRADADDDALWDALESAQAADFVRQKPGQLGDPVEQAGRNLSGGQRQRLTVARALVGRPPLLILDDSASALDYATDAALRKALRALPWKPTVFIVSQRTASMRHADRILVLDDGRLVGIGTHDELTRTCPVYREIHESQYQKGDERA
ncbi:MAG: ABC transporter ATP-binding protein [Clostridia bacterium]|nr:ABC transporter ATP-binding protein [Clostridia bacterium]